MRNNKYGFTLVEIIIVIVVIGILSTVGAFTYTGVQSEARDGQRQSQATIIANALEEYYEQNGEYPICIDNSYPLASNPKSVLTKIDEKVFIAPRANDINNESVNCITEPVTSISEDAFSYQYDNASKNWKLWYISETEEEPLFISSKH